MRISILEKTMASVNKVILLGNCGRDPEIVTSPLARRSPA
jgi:single-stranded DNA-binding protein